MCGADADAMPSTPLEIRRRRVRLIRRRVVGATTAIFMASTGAIFLQLVSGHDPALARSQTTAHTSTSSVAVATGSPTTGSSSRSTSSSAGSTSSGSATAVTTRAS
jgi:hypothetical protein